VVLVSRPAKLAAFALVLAVSFGGGAALGASVGPIDVGDEPHDNPPGQPAPHVDHEP